MAGERRWRAHKLLGRETIAALMREMNDEQASGVMLLENIQRAELNPIEETRAYRKRMEQFGWDVERTSQAANVPLERVRLRLTLLDTVPEAQEAMFDMAAFITREPVCRDYHLCSAGSRLGSPYSGRCRRRQDLLCAGGGMPL